MAFLYAVDGTGADSDEQYRIDMMGSHCRTLVQRWNGKNKGRAYYHRGPTLAGFECPAEAQLVYQAAVAYRSGMNSRGPIFLAGHSRGGIAVIRAARMLQDVGIGVSCMILFDAVDRCLQIPFSSIPSNVARVIHAMRDPRTLSRIGFGHCGIVRYPMTSYSSQFFWATHGACGGTPWPIPAGKTPQDYVWESGCAISTAVTYQDDRLGSQAVWGWVQPQILAALAECQSNAQQTKGSFARAG